MGEIAPSLPELGAVLAGKYRIVRRIGEGGMGVVYEAIHLRLRQKVAIKMLLPEMMSIADVVSRFEREARAAGQLRGDNAARVLDVEATASGIPYMVMEFLDGHDLSDKIVRQGRLPIAESVDYVLQACNAMREAHKLGIVHRDLKPSNLFLANVDGRVIIKVLDFGISKVDDEREARVTGTQATVGTPLYMSPEQIRSAKHVDARTDIWSLGIILFELLVGKTPYEGSTTAAAVAICVDPVPRIRHLRPDVPETLEAIIMKALAKERGDRFPNVEAFASALMPYASSTGVAAMASNPSFQSLPQITGYSNPPPSSDELVWGARTELGSDGGVGVGAKRQGAATAGSWSTQSGQRKKRTSPILIAAMAGIGLAVGIFGVLIAFSQFSGPKTDPSADPGKAGVATATATTTTTAASTATATTTATPTIDTAPIPTTQISSLPIAKTAPTPTVKVRPPPTGTTSTKPSSTTTAPPTNTNAPAHI